VNIRKPRSRRGIRWLISEAVKIAGSLKRGDVAVLLHAVAQKIEAQGIGEVAMTGGRRINI
jgi:hypothetical protein